MAEKNGKSHGDGIRQDDIDDLLRGMDGEEGFNTISQDEIDAILSAGTEKKPSSGLSSSREKGAGEGQGFPSGIPDAEKGREEAGFDTVSQEDIDAFLRGDFDPPQPEVGGPSSAPLGQGAEPEQSDVFASGMVGQADIDALFADAGLTSSGAGQRASEKTSSPPAAESFESETLSQDDIEALLSGADLSPKKAPSPPAAESFESETLSQDDIEALLSGADLSPKRAPSPPAAESFESETLSQDDIEALLSGAGSSPEKAPSPPAAES
ncbi:hypothetical protein, partial [Desulfobotulus sp.]|uniref:hypothetical protein n=1 Tax=Desulfobotulus sp. TaxID=1940337 RepID=UPI002A36D8A8